MSAAIEKYIASRLPFAIGFATAAIVACGANKGGFWFNVTAVMIVAFLPFLGALVGAGIGNFFGVGRPVEIGQRIGSWTIAVMLFGLVAISYLFKS